MKLKSIAKYIREVLDYPFKAKKVLDYTELKVVDCQEEIFLLDRNEDVVYVITEYNNRIQCIKPKQYAKSLNELADFKNVAPFEEE